MHIKKTLFCLLTAATVISQNFAICAAGATATTGAEDADTGSVFNCNDVETYFVDGYGWPAPGITTEESLGFEEELDELLWDEESEKFKIEYGFHAPAAIVDFVKRPSWLETANIILNPVEASALRKDVVDGGKSVARKVNYHENVGRCPNTKFVIAGFGIGAAKAREALQYINPDKVLYVALFSDPTLYLPEGEGLIPDACLGKNLSSYRMYVPDCRTYTGVLGGADPYVPSGYEGKLGTWCNKNDMFCGSGVSMAGNSRYEEDGIYEDAAKVVYDKISQEYNLDRVYSPHDTAILIDSTGSMQDLIDGYKTEALKLAEKTLESGGRVALYDYRDIADEYEPRERCNFETCTLETFEKGLQEIETDGGGDTPESLLSASFNVMKRLNWNYGATKSVVVLTDADYHNPDLDGVTFDDVVKLSKSIDPVNFYIITPSGQVKRYRSLAEATDGDVVLSTSDLSLLTQKIIERYDSLPRVEESDGDYEGNINDIELIRRLVAEYTESSDDAETPVVEEGETSVDALDVTTTVVIPKAPNTGRK